MRKVLVGLFLLAILDEARVNGKKWYKVEHPTQEGTAWIAGDYVRYGLYDGKPTGWEFVKVRQTFGIYPEKARALFGAGKTRDYGGSLQIEYPDVTLVYDTNSQGIFANTLANVSVKSKKFAFCGIRLNDRAEKLLKLGMPKSELDEMTSELGRPSASRDEDDETPDSIFSWNYDSSASDEYIYFRFEWDSREKAAVVHEMAWYNGRTLYTY